MAPQARPPQWQARLPLAEPIFTRDAIDIVQIDACRIGGLNEVLSVLLMAASPRPIRFLMDHRIFKVPVLGGLFRLAKAIPVAPQKEDPAAYEAAFAAAAQVLREGDLLGIFPEGGITRDGTLQPFKGGIAKILAQAQADGVPVSVIPMALTNLWGSYFSRVELAGGEPTAMVKPFRRGVFSRVGLNVGEAVRAEAVTPESLRERVAGLLGN